MLRSCLLSSYYSWRWLYRCCCCCCWWNWNPILACGGIFLIFSFWLWNCGRLRNVCCDIWCCCCCCCCDLNWTDLLVKFATVYFFNVCLLSLLLNTRISFFLNIVNLDDFVLRVAWFNHNLLSFLFGCFTSKLACSSHWSSWETISCRVFWFFRVIFL